jgi:hypothetical protein
MFSLARSTAHDFTNPRKANFVAVYVAKFCCPTKPLIDEILTIELFLFCLREGKT